MTTFAHLRPNLGAALLLTGLFLTAPPALAWERHPWEAEQGYGPFWRNDRPSGGYEQGYSDGYSRGRAIATPRFSPGPLLIEPPKTYPKTPTLGDPRNYRKTDPRRCLGLLCD